MAYPNPADVAGLLKDPTVTVAMVPAKRVHFLVRGLLRDGPRGCCRYPATLPLRRRLKQALLRSKPK